MIDFESSIKKKYVTIKILANGLIGKITKYLSIVLFLIGLGLFLVDRNGLLENQIWGIITSIGLITISYGIFLNNYSFDKKINSNNLADRIDYEIHILWKKTKNNKNFIPLFLSNIINSLEGRFIFNRLELDPVVTLELIYQESQNNMIDFANISQIADQKRADLKKNEITAGDYISALFEENQNLKEWLNTRKINIEEINKIVYWWDRLKKTIESTHDKKQSWFKIEPIGQEWSMGYANALFYFTKNISEYVRKNINYIHIYGRRNEISQLENALSSSKAANALLVGPPGIGKSAIVEGLAYNILNKNTTPTLNNKRVYQVNSSFLFSGVNTTSEVKNRLMKILNDLAHYGNGILFIEDIHNFFDSSNSKIAASDFSDVILPYLSSNLQLIGSTTWQDYHATISKNSSLNSLFHQIEVTEPDDTVCELILEDIVPIFESKNKVFITFSAIKSAILLSKRYIHDVPLPEKAIQLLEQGVLECVKSNNDLVNASYMESVVTIKTNVPLGDISEEEGNKLNNIENEMHEQIIGQDEAIKAISNALRRSRAGLTDEKRPIGSFLFLGPTGVGKTETAKTLAKVYFGNEASMIRLDMSEYQEVASISRLIGDNGNSGYLTDAVYDNPFSLVLLEELEKANKDLLNIFLQVLEDGRLTDGLGRTIDFTNTIIIATSNAGSQQINQLIRQNTSEEDLKNKVIESIINQRIYRPEFINRFDGVIVFRSLNSREIKEIIKLMLKDIQRNLESKQIFIDFDDDVVNDIAKKGIHPEFGARPLRRYIQDNIENKIASMLLNNELHAGQTLRLNMTNFL